MFLAPILAVVARQIQTFLGCRTMCPVFKVDGDSFVSQTCTWLCFTIDCTCIREENITKQRVRIFLICITLGSTRCIPHAACWDWCWVQSAPYSINIFSNLNDNPDFILYILECPHFVSMWWVKLPVSNLASPLRRFTIAEENQKLQATDNGLLAS